MDTSGATIAPAHPVAKEIDARLAYPLPGSLRQTHQDGQIWQAIGQAIVLYWSEYQSANQAEPHRMNKHRIQPLVCHTRVGRR